jgi:hypothetical protein
MVRLMLARAEAPHARHQLGQHALALRVLVARVQGAQLDGDAVIRFHRAVGAGAFGDGLDGIRVAGKVAQRVALGARAFAQHVVREPEVGRRLARAVRLAHRLGDVLAQHELPPEQLHRAQRRRDHGLGAELAEQAAFTLRIGQEFLGHGQRRARQASQRAVGRAFEVCAAQLVGGESDRGFGIGHAQ